MQHLPRPVRYVQACINQFISSCTYSPDRNPDELVWKHLRADTVGRMTITDKSDFKAKVRASMCQLQNDPEKIRTKNYRSNMPPDSAFTYGLINRRSVAARSQAGRGRLPPCSMGRGLPRSAAVLASIAGGGAVVHFSVHQCTGFGAFHCTPCTGKPLQLLASIALPQHQHSAPPLCTTTCTTTCTSKRTTQE